MPFSSTLTMARLPLGKLAVEIVLLSCRRRRGGNYGDLAGAVDFDACDNHTRSGERFNDTAHTSLARGSPLGLTFRGGLGQGEWDVGGGGGHTLTHSGHEERKSPGT